jgi:hypothetical protein
MNGKKTLTRLAGLTALLVWLVASVGVPQTAFAASGDDDRFIASLTGKGDGHPVDRKRLAKLFFSVASTLEGSKHSVQRLTTLLPSREEPDGSIVDVAGAQYETYVRHVKQFNQSVNDLLDNPDSGLRLYRVLMDGNQACWQLYVFYNLVDTYSVSGADMLTALASPEVCEKFRTAAFQPRVIGLVASDLAERLGQERELEILREELYELERLLQDLRSIDEGAH